MGNIGIICNEVDHSLFSNFRMALTNHLNKTFKDVKNVNDLNDIQTLIIIDEHYTSNVNIWKNNNFITELNNNKIKVVVFNFERIHSAQFPWNIDHQRVLEQINNLTQFVSDVEDARLMNKTVINKQLLSKDTNFNLPAINKKNRIVFIGQVNDYYPTRRQVLQKAKDIGLPIDIIVTDRKYNYKDFLTKLYEYKFVFNPLGTGKFINLRYYEALKLGCIPIQQITDDMEKWYDELHSSINFTDIGNLSFDNISNFCPNYLHDYYLEDYFDEIELKEYFND